MLRTTKCIVAISVSNKNVAQQKAIQQITKKRG